MQRFIAAITYLDVIDEIINHIKNECNFLTDSPKPKRENTNTQPLADSFFSVPKQSICSVIQNRVHRETFFELLGHLNTMLSVT